MCETNRPNFYEDGFRAPCNAVWARADQIARERYGAAGVEDLTDKQADAVLAEASEYVHPEDDRERGEE